MLAGIELHLEAKASGRPLEKLSSDPQHRIERRALAQEQLAKRTEEYAQDVHNRLPKYVPDDAWRQWNGHQRDNESGREIEPRLPHADGVLAVSDWAFAQLAKSIDVGGTAKGALAAIHLDHLAAKDSEQRHKAERAYYVNSQAVEAEQRRQAAVHAAEYRAGTRQTPRVPSWSEAASTLLGTMVERATEVVKRAYRELTHLYDQSIAVNRRNDERIDPTYAPGQEHGKTHERVYQKAYMEMVRAQREREAARERDRGPDLDFGPSR